MALPTSELTPDNCIFMTIDRQVGLMSFLTSIEPMLLKNNIIGHAKTAKAVKNAEEVKQMLAFTGNPPIG
jgi:hypothetical protein